MNSESEGKRMKVIVINEKNHGDIGTEKDYYSAVSFLMNDGWLAPYDDVWDEHKEDWIPICELLGEDWIDKIFSWDIDNFNEFFGCSFHLTEEEIT